jgi:hypothetical protein
MHFLHFQAAMISIKLNMLKLRLNEIKITHLDYFQLSL